MHELLSEHNIEEDRGMVEKPRHCSSICLCVCVCLFVCLFVCLLVCLFVGWFVCRC